MSTYKFEVTRPEEIDIPRICRENADQDAFVVIAGDKIIYANNAKLELRSRTDYYLQPETHRGTLDVTLNTKIPTADTKPWDFGWDYITTDRPVKFRTTNFFKRVAEAQEKLRKKILVTVIAKD